LEINEIMDKQIEDDLWHWIKEQTEDEDEQYFLFYLIEPLVIGDPVMTENYNWEQIARIAGWDKE